MSPHPKSTSPKKSREAMLTAPLIQEAKSLQRKAARFASSSTVPSRPQGILSIISLSNAPVGSRRLKAPLEIKKIVKLHFFNSTPFPI